MSTTPPQEPGTGTAEQAALDAAADIVDDAAEREFGPQESASMDSLDTPRRLLLVHAHPDDESIATGATIARYAAAPGTRVTLVTCTRGERGEVIGDALAHLGDDPDALAEHRTGELAAATEALGVADHRFLGADVGVRYVDSGMAWGPDGRATAAPDAPPQAFSAADVDDAAVHLARVLREVRPQVVIGYDAGGGYGHPDHVQAHRVTRRAVELAAGDGGDGEPWHVAKLYEVVVPHRVAQASRRASAGPDNPFDAPDPELAQPAAVPDDVVAAVVDAPEHLPAKVAALRAHATQVRLSEGFFALSNGVGQPLSAQEWFALARGVPAPDGDRDDGLETDLFAGLA